MNTENFGSKRPRASTRRHATSSGLISADGIAINASRLADLMRSASAALSLPRPSCQLPSARVNAIPAAAASVGHSDGLKRKFDIAGKQLAPGAVGHAVRIADAGFSLWHYHDQALRKKTPHIGAARISPAGPP